MKVADSTVAKVPAVHQHSEAEEEEEEDHKDHELLPPAVARSTPRLPVVPASASTASWKAYAGRLFREPPAWLPIVLLISNQVVFAGMHVVVSPALHYMPPIALAMMRVCLAVPLLFALARKEGALSKITRKDASFMLLLGVVGVALPQTLVFTANHLAGPNVVAIMAPLAPVDAALIAAVLHLEKLTPVKVGGILLAVAGALVVLRPDQMDWSTGPSDTTSGICVMVVQCFCYASFLVALKIKMKTHPHPFALYSWASLIGVALIALFGLVSGTVFFDVAAVPTSAWMAVLYCGVVVSFGAHAANVWCVAHTSASLPALFSCLAPFFTGFLAYIFLGETIGSASDIIGLLLNVSGLLAVIYSKTYLEHAAVPVASASGPAATTTTTLAVQPAAEPPGGGQEPEQEQRQPGAPHTPSSITRTTGTLKTVLEEPPQGA